MRNSSGAEGRAVVGQGIALGVAFALLVLLLGAGTAHGATVGKRVLFDSFCTETGATGGRCGFAQSIGVNASGAGGVEAGSVYVANSDNRRVEQFSPVGDFVRAFGWDVVSSGEHNVGVGYEICEADSDPADVCKQGLQVGSPGALSSPQGIAVDPQTGNVLVADNGAPANSGKRISVYSATGVFQGAFGVGVETGASTLEFCTTATGCLAGSVSAKGGGFNNLTKAALAADPSTGNLYAGDRGNLRINEFSFTLTGSGEVTGASFVRSFGYNVATPWANEVQRITITGTGTFKLVFDPDGAGPLPSETTAALANSTTGANAASVLGALPSVGAGNVTGSGSATNPKVLTFTAALGARDHAQLVASELTGTIAVTVTTDSEGFGSGPALETCSTSESCQTGLAGGGDGQFAVNTPIGIAVDDAGYIYAVTAAETCDSTVNPCRVQKFSPDGTITGANASWGPDSGGAEQCQLNWTSGLNREQGPEGIAIDSDTGAVYVTRKVSATGGGNSSATFELCEFDGAGNLVDRSPSVPLSSTSQGSLQPGAGPNETVYVNVLRGAGGLSSVALLGIPPLPPEATILSPTALTATSASLNGKVTIPEPGGIGYGTTYRFELSSDFGQNWQSLPVPDASVGSVAGDIPVGLTVDDLLPNQKYRVRLVATNAAGSDTSDQFFFDTPLELPTISKTRALPVSDTSATLRANVNPNSSATTYRFEWGTSSKYGSVSPDFEPLAGEGAAAIPVAVSLSSLTPATTYHFRLVATNAAGTSRGPDVSFTTNACPLSGPNGLASCRNFELVSPDDQGPVAESTGVFAGEGDLQFQVAPDGSTLAYSVSRGLPISTTGGEVLYRATRGGGGWSSSQLSPPSLSPSTNPGETAFSGLFRYLAEDVSCGFFGSREALSGNVPQVTLDRGEASLYRVDAAGEHTLITSLGAVAPTSTARADAYFVVGASEDCERVIFTSPQRYEGIDFSGGVGSPGLYEWAEGTLSGIGRIPGPSGPVLAAPVLAGSATAGGASNRRYLHAVSNDARRVYFRAASQVGDDAGNIALFLSTDGGVGVNVSQSETPVPNRGAFFQTASASGARAFFLANYGLTSQPSLGPTTIDCGPGSPVSRSALRCDLYEYDVGAGDLRSITATNNPANPQGAEVAGVLDASADGSHVYFAARGQLLSRQGRSYASNVSADTYNVYLAVDGSTDRFVGYVKGSELDAGQLGPGQLIAPKGATAISAWSSRAAADGAHFIFQTAANVTGYDSGGVTQAYRYSVPDDTTACISCPPDESPSVGDGSTLPLVGRTGSEGPQDIPFPRRSLSSDGSRVFFSAPDVLAPGAIENGSNLYQWEKGHVTLIAAYARPGLREKVVFMGASADGDSVFFHTPERLLPADLDNRPSVYVARVGGGAAPPPTPPAPCDPLAEGGCQGPPTPAGPPPPPPVTSGMIGAGNVIEQGQEKNKGKAKKKKAKKGAKKRKKARAAQRGVARLKGGQS